MLLLPQRYIFSSKSQPCQSLANSSRVVVATTKVHIFKQITTLDSLLNAGVKLLLLPQRYIFSSKSQPVLGSISRSLSCCCYHKGTYFQANHNVGCSLRLLATVVVATTKVHIFKQITTLRLQVQTYDTLLLLPQRYIFSSKSQLLQRNASRRACCCCYHKGTYFQANHNLRQ